MPRVVWQSVVKETAGQVRLVECEHTSVKYPAVVSAFILESSRTRDALGAPVWMPVDIWTGAPRDANAIRAAFNALGELAIREQSLGD